MPKKKKKKKNTNKAEAEEKKILRDQKTRSIKSLLLALKRESTDEIEEWLRQHQKTEFFSSLSENQYDNMLRQFRTDTLPNLKDEAVNVLLDMDELLLALRAIWVDPLNEWKEKNRDALNFLLDSGPMAETRFLPISTQRQIIHQLDLCRVDNRFSRRSQWSLENEKLSIMLDCGLNPKLLIHDEKLDLKDLTPLLHRQIVLGQLTQVKLLIDHGAFTGMKNSELNVVFKLAIRFRQEDIFELLNKKSGNPYLSERPDGSTPLMVAAQCDFRKIVGKLIKSDPACVNTANRNNETALFFAAQEGHAETAKLLASKMESPFLARELDGTTPIMIAAMYGHVEVLEKLLYIAGFHEHKDAQRTDLQKLTALSLSHTYASITSEKRIESDTVKRESIQWEKALNCLYALLAFGCKPTITTPVKCDASVPQGSATIDANLLHMLTAVPSGRHINAIKVILEWLEIASTTSLDDMEKTGRVIKNPILKYYKKHRKILSSIKTLPSPANLQQELFYAPNNVIESVVIPNNDIEMLTLFLKFGYDIRHDKIRPLHERSTGLLTPLKLRGEPGMGHLNPVFALTIATHSASCADLLLSSSCTQRGVKDTTPLLNNNNILFAWTLAHTYAKDLQANSDRYKDFIQMTTIILSYDFDDILSESNGNIDSPINVLNHWASSQEKAEPAHQISSLRGQGEGEGEGACESAEEFLDEWPGVWPAESQTKQSHTKRYLNRLACQSDWQDEHHLLVHVQLQPDPDQALADLHTLCDEESLPKLKSTLLNINTKGLCSIQDDENERKTAAQGRKKELEGYRDTLTRYGTEPKIICEFSDEIESLAHSIEELRSQLYARQKRIDENHRIENAAAQIKAYLGDHISTQFFHAIVGNNVKQFYSVFRQHFIYDLRPIKAPLSEILPYLMTSNTQQEIVDMIRKELLADEIRPTLFRLFPLKKTHDETEGETIALKGTDAIRRGPRKEEVDTLRDQMVSRRAYWYLFEPLQQNPTMKRGFPQGGPAGGNEDTWRYIFSFLGEKPAFRKKSPAFAILSAKA